MTITFETITRDEALAYILSGLQAKRAGIDAALRDLRSMNADAAAIRKDIAVQQLAQTAAQVAGTPPRKRRKMSAATRKNMAAAQRARWAKVRKAEAN